MTTARSYVRGPNRHRHECHAKPPKPKPPEMTDEWARAKAASKIMIAEYWRAWRYITRAPLNMTPLHLRGET